MKVDEEIKKNLDELFLKFRETGIENYLSQIVSYINPWLFKIIYRMIGNRESAMDIVQDTWMIVLKCKNNFTIRKGKFESYIFRIAKHEVFHWIKKQKKIKKIEKYRSISDDYTTNINDLEEISIILRKLIKLLKKNYQDAILLHYFAGLKISEVSRILNTNEQNVKNWLRRGRLKLGEELKHYRELDDFMI